MKHKGRVLLVYICIMSMVVVTVVVYQGTWPQDIHQFVSLTEKEYRLPKILKQYVPFIEESESTIETGKNTAIFTSAEPPPPHSELVLYHGGETGKNNTFAHDFLTSKDYISAYWNTDVPQRVSIYAMPKHFHREVHDVKLYGSSVKKILIWNEGYGSKTMGFGFGQAPFQLAKCEVDTCLTTGNRSLVSLKDYDAIIFHFRATSPKDMPRSRYYHQRWIFEEIESSAYVFQDPAIYNGLFNWTMTFRRDSDIVNTYGRIFKVGSPVNATVTRINYAEGKTKMAAWFVSNCYSKSSREKIVRKLQKHFEVDVFGRCGPYTCPHTKQCYEFLEKNYKFYFSFENSLCKDYVTEKLFQILKYNIVPVVYGLADYDLTAPPDSFINVLDYPDLDSLAKYLKYLDSNDTAYSMYFRWKGFFKIENGWSNTAQSFCDLCKKLHQDNTPKVYDDINKWFIIQGNCKKLKTKGWF